MWRLPDGREIVNPQRGRKFQIGDTIHLEQHLLKWDDTELAKHGIFRVVRLGYDDRQFVCTMYSETVEGQVITLTPVLVPSSDKVEKFRTQQLSAANSAVQIYLCDHYDLGTQSTFQALYSLNTTAPAIKTQLESVFEWIKSVMGYYYTVKDLIKAAPDFDTLELVSWDFSSFDSTDPGVVLQQIING